MVPPVTQRDPEPYAHVHERSGVRGVVAAGAVLGTILTASGMVLVLGQVEASMRPVAAFALMVPLSLYIAWWMLLSGLWSAPTGKELEMTDNTTNPDLVASIFDQAYGDDDPAVLRSSLRRLDVDDTVVAQLRASVPPPVQQERDLDDMQQLRRSS
jgi:hypothetical protein